MGRKRRDDTTIDGSTAVLDKPSRLKRTCNHYWIIEIPKGPTSRGKCKFCGKEKEFDNLGPDSWRYGDMSGLPATNIPDLNRDGS